MRFSRLLTTALAGIALSIGAPALASGVTGWIEYTDPICDYFIVDALDGYAVLEWYGGAFPIEGWVITGSYNRYGFKTVRMGKRARLRVWVEDYWLGRDEAYDVMYQNC